MTKASGHNPLVYSINKNFQIFTLLSLVQKSNKCTYVKSKVIKPKQTYPKKESHVKKIPQIPRDKYKSMNKKFKENNNNNKTKNET